MLRPAVVKASCTLRCLVLAETFPSRLSARNDGCRHMYNKSQLRYGATPWPPFGSVCRVVAILSKKNGVLRVA
eukprot:5370116-Pleurochrysis_carterae.AAC.1